MWGGRLPLTAYPDSSNGLRRSHITQLPSLWLLQVRSYSVATVTGATTHADAAEYPHSTLNGTPTYSSHSGTAFHETYVTDQEKSDYIYMLTLTTLMPGAHIPIVTAHPIYRTYSPGTSSFIVAWVGIARECHFAHCICIFSWNWKKIWCKK